MESETDDSPEPMETAFTLDQTAGGEFLSLDDLGNLLSHLASQGLNLAFMANAHLRKRSFTGNYEN